MATTIKFFVYAAIILAVFAFFNREKIFSGAEAVKSALGFRAEPKPLHHPSYFATSADSSPESCKKVSDKELDEIVGKHKDEYLATLDEYTDLRVYLPKYEVQKGESLSEIAKKHGILLEDILSENKLGKNDLIKPGEKLKVMKRSFMHFGGFASYYGEDFHGKPTSSGETYDMNSLTAASIILPEGTIAKVTNLKNRKSVTVRINDKGPYVVGEKSGKLARVIDLSQKAMEEIDGLGPGVVPVRIEVLNKSSIDYFLVNR